MMKIQPPTAEKSGKYLAERHVRELNEYIDLYGGAESAFAVDFMMAYMQGLQDLKKTLGV
jgi:hypothetical protein